MKRKNIIFGIATMSVFAVLSCGSKDSSKDKQDTQQVTVNILGTDDPAAPKTEKGVIDMLQKAYHDANILSTTDDLTDPDICIDLFGKYCSRVFNEKMNEICDIQDSTGVKFPQIPDQIGMFVYWEGDTVTIKDIDVAINGDTAIASYNLSNGKKDMMTVVELVYEDAKWHFNDWQQIGPFTLNTMKAMDEYLETNRKR